MLPCPELVGVELDPDLLAIAKSRAAYYGYDNVKFLSSPSSDQLPEGIGKFDFVILSAVYEHLLPDEREMLLPKLWNLLNSGGILFLNQTPFRYFPIESHTTSGLPFINYLPDGLACILAKRCSKRNLQNDTWQELLRKGIRGGNLREINRILACCSGKPILMEPSRLGVNGKRVDLWYSQAQHAKFRTARNLYFHAAKVFSKATGMVMLPYLSLALKKG